ncbi:MAG TPA: hypothetical protein VHC39_00695 [Rhizomicrobium sp.]|nr:hypothetical protein [Rhizomicrobium sp.]
MLVVLRYGDGSILQAQSRQNQQDVWRGGPDGGAIHWRFPQIFQDCDHRNSTREFRSFYSLIQKGDDATARAGVQCPDGLTAMSDQDDFADGNYPASLSDHSKNQLVPTWMILHIRAGKRSGPGRSAGFTGYVCEGGWREHWSRRCDGGKG